jgi:type VI secretion system protein ImpF
MSAVMSAVMSEVMADRGGRPVVHPREQRLPSTVAVDARARETVYLPTLFDRLCDDMPSERSEAPDIYSYKRNQLRAIVQRDLAFLLNTTRDDPAQGSSHAASSTLHYGVAPLAGGYLSETKWAQVEHVIRQAILDFEPRLDPQTLQVRPLSKEHDSANYNVLTFEIAGHILMQPYPIEFLVQSAVDLENSRIELHDARP